MSAITKRVPKKSNKLKKQRSIWFWNQLNEIGIDRLSEHSVDRDLSECWESISGRLATLFSDRMVCPTPSGKKSPLSWLLNDATNVGNNNEVNSWWSSLYGRKSSQKRRQQVCTSVKAAAATLPAMRNQNQRSFIGLGVTYALPGIADRLELHEFFQLVAAVSGLETKYVLQNEGGGSDLWREQCLEVEIPIYLGSLLPYLDELKEARDLAIERMEKLISESLDNDGWPNSICLPVFGPLLASWSRCYRLLNLRKIPLHPDAKSQLEWSVRQLLRLMRPDRTLAMGGFAGSQPVTKSCLREILRISSDVDDRPLADHVLGKRSLSADERPAASSISEWAESGMLQSGWRKGSPKIAFDYSRTSFQIEIMAKTTLIAGTVVPEIYHAGSKLKFDRNFQIVCEHSDDDLDYVEFEAELADEVVLNRQLILSRQERFCILADALRCHRPGAIDYECRWPLAPDVEVMHETETNEIYLRNRGIQALVLPLSIPEWKAERRGGSLLSEKDGFKLKMSSGGPGLYAPLFIDLSPKRSQKPRTWRQLTVAQNMEIVGPETAAAFRIQIGRKQWLLYRAISSKGIRTYLGENFGGEFVFSQFDRDGTVTELLRIE
jgi:hypothetical protein